jgi:hypothetical protein
MGSLDRAKGGETFFADGAWRRLLFEPIRWAIFWLAAPGKH